MQKAKGACKPIVVGVENVNKLCACADHLVFLDAEGSLFSLQWGAADPRKMAESRYLCVDGRGEENKVWAINAEKIRLECLEVSGGKVLQSLTPPQDLPRKGGERAILHAASDNLVVVGMGTTMVAMHLGEGTPRWYIWDDPVRGDGEGELRLASLPRWSKRLGELVLVGDTSSLDIGCAGVIETFHSFFLTNEEFLMQMPFVKGEETYPRALAIDYTCAEVVELSNQEDPLLPPQPIVWIINSAGLFCPFRIVKTDEPEAHPSMKHKTIEMPVFSPTTESPLPREPLTKDPLTVSVGKPAAAAAAAKEEEEEEEEAPILFPMLSKLTEDHGLITNAIAAEFLGLYSAFNDDLDRIRSIAVGVNEAIVKHRSAVETLHEITPTMAKLCGTLDKGLAAAVEREKKMIKHFQRCVDRTLTNQPLFTSFSSSNGHCESQG